MKTALVNVSAAVYVPAGEYLDGATLTEARWVRPGQCTLRLEFAQAQETAGVAAVVSVDGAPFVWGACCTGEHDSA